MNFAHLPVRSFKSLTDLSSRPLQILWSHNRMSGFSCGLICPFCVFSTLPSLQDESLPSPGPLSSDGACPPLFCLLSLRPSRIRGMRRRDGKLPSPFTSFPTPTSPPLLSCSDLLSGQMTPHTPVYTLLFSSRLPLSPPCDTPLYVDTSKHPPSGYFPRIVFSVFFRRPSFSRTPVLKAMLFLIVVLSFFSDFSFAC